MQPGSAKPAQWRRRGAGNSERGAALPHVWAGRIAATASGKYTGPGAPGETGALEQHAGLERRLAQLRIRGRLDRRFGNPQKIYGGAGDFLVVAQFGRYSK